MYCKNCGTKQGEGERFCSMCGTPFMAEKGGSERNIEMGIKKAENNSKRLQIISRNEIFSLAKAKTVIIAKWIVILGLIGMGMLCLYLSLFMADEGYNSIVGFSVFLLCIVLGGYFCYFIYSGGEYIPNKSFRYYRLGKETQRRVQIGVTIIGGLMMCLNAINGEWGLVLQGIFALVVMYYVILSYKFHEDVDYVANQVLEDLIGCNIDEKIIASYQNYDSENVDRKKGDSLLVVTNRKFFYAVYDGNTWFSLKRRIQDLMAIGYTGSIIGGGEYILGLRFKDETAVSLKMCTINKITSNSDLFFKRVLCILDAYLLGETITGNKPRRRVSVGTTSATGTASEPSSARKVNLEISEEMAAQIKAGEEIGSGRRIEI